MACWIRPRPERTAAGPRSPGQEAPSTALVAPYSGINRSLIEIDIYCAVRLLSGRDGFHVVPCREPFWNHNDRLAYLVHGEPLNELLAIGLRSEDRPDRVPWCDRIEDLVGLPSRHSSWRAGASRSAIERSQPFWRMTPIDRRDRRPSWSTVSGADRVPYCPVSHLCVRTSQSHAHSCLSW